MCPINRTHRKRVKIMKIRVNNIYDDNHTLFASNTLISSDDRLSDISDMVNDLDLIASTDFESREIVERYLKPDNSEYRVYDLTKIHRAIYSCLVQNLTKYTALIESDNLLNGNIFRQEYGEEIVHGESIKTLDYASRVDTTAHGNIANTKQYGATQNTKQYGATQKTNTYGDIDTTDNIGATTESTTVGARQNTSAVTTFDSAIFNDTDKVSSASANDSTSLSSQINTSKVTHGNETESTTTHTDTTSDIAHTDTENITHGNDTVTHGAHQDTITDDETIDTKEGYRDLMGNIDRVRRIYSRSVLNEIVTDCINHFTYSCYL